jgi:hypothetical protein
MKQQAEKNPQHNKDTMRNIEPHSAKDKLYMVDKKTRTPRPRRTPSQILDDYWVSARARKNRVPFTERSGKWLIFVPLDEVDDAWAKIKKATEAGLLGNSSKAATALSNPNAADPTKRVICVYTGVTTGIDLTQPPVFCRRAVHPPARRGSSRRHPTRH